MFKIIRSRTSYKKLILRDDNKLTQKPDLDKELLVSTIMPTLNNSRIVKIAQNILIMILI